MNSVLNENIDKKLTILLIEADEDNYIFMRDFLNQAPFENYTLEWVSEYEAALTALKARHVSVCLLNHRLGKFNGLSLLKRFGKDIQSPPIILLTGEDDFDLDKKGMKYGAEDFLDKSRLTTEQLERSLRYAIAHRQDQRELIRKEAHYHHIVDAALNAIVVIDEEGKIIEWNTQAEKVFGWKHGEVVGKKLESYILPERHQTAHHNGITRFLETGESRILDQQLELSALNALGEEIPILLTVTSVTYSDRLNFVVFIEDLSQRKKAEEATRRYKQIVETTSDMMAFVDRELVYQAVNDAYMKAFNRDYEKIIGHKVEELFDKDYPLIHKHLTKCIAGEDVYYEAWLHFPATGRRYMQIHYNPFRNVDGNVTGVAVNSRDYTEQKRAQDELHRKSVLLESVSRIQSEFISQSGSREFFDELLKLSLQLGESSFGFIALLERIPKRDEAALIIHAISSNHEFKESENVGQQILSEGLRINNLDNLPGDVIKNGEIVINNNLVNDPHLIGLSGAPPLNSFLGVPFRRGDEVVGMICFANRPQGYDQELIDYLQPLLGTSSAIINAINISEKRKQTEQKYRYLYDENPAMFLTVAADGSIISINAFGLEQLGRTKDSIENTTLLDILHPNDRKLARLTLVDIFNNPDQITTWEMRVRRNDGKIFWVRNTARVVKTEGHSDAALIVCEDITQARELSEELSYQASHDPLTGFVNRRELERRLTNSINHACLHHVEHALCYIDLDQFKLINDTAGHSAGDDLLRQLAAVLNSKIRNRDTLARIGGDEFAVLVEHCTLDQARRVAELLRQAITDFNFFWKDRQFRIGASIGVVPINQSSTDMNDVLRLADSACYAAKDAGRNSIHVYEESDQAMLERRGEMLWVERVQNAIDNDQFELYYQDIKPILSKDERNHYEILIRLKNDDGTITDPAAFLPAAERYNIIGKVDRWVIREVFRWLKQNSNAQEALSLCSINLSGQSFGDESMLGFIREQLMLCSIDARKICFEITETAAITNLNNAINFMNECGKDGFRFALDDFGSGLSSFGYLKTLPVDYVKIDGLFVRELVDSDIDRAMVKSINEVAHVMGKETIAEFVEDEKIIKILRKFKVDYAQGYAVGRPAPLRDLMD